MNEDDFVKRMYEGWIKGEGVQRRPPLGWINTMDEYWLVRAAREGIKCAEREYWNRKSWRCVCYGYCIRGNSDDGTRHQRDICIDRWLKKVWQLYANI